MAAQQGAPHVVVVGGGLAGTAAAWRLASRGARVTLLEQGPDLGGRARHAEREGFRWDVGAHLLGAGDAAVRALAEEAGLGARLLPLAQRRGPDTDASEARFAWYKGVGGEKRAQPISISPRCSATCRRRRGYRRITRFARRGS